MMKRCLTYFEIPFGFLCFQNSTQSSNTRCKNYKCHDAASFSFQRKNLKYVLGSKFTQSGLNIVKSVPSAINFNFHVTAI